MGPRLLASTLDEAIAQSLPFLPHWAIAFGAFTLGGSLPLYLEANARGERLPLEPWRYALAILLPLPLTGGIYPQLLLALTCFVPLANYLLANGQGLPWFTRLTRVTLLTLCASLPLSYLDPAPVEGVPGLPDPHPLSPWLPGIGVAFGLVALTLLGRGQAALDRRERNERRLNRAVDHLREDILTHLGRTCPYCRESLQHTRAHRWGHCPDCQVLLHHECATEQGHCPTLGCRRNHPAWPLERVTTGELLTLARPATRPPRVTPRDLRAASRLARKG